MLEPIPVSEIVKTIREEYEEYRSIKNDKDSHEEYTQERLADARVHLVRRLIRESRNLVKNDMFNSLMEDEVEYMDTDFYDDTKLTKLIAVSRALRMARGIDAVDIDYIQSLHKLEADLILNEVAEEDFFVQYRIWLTDQIFGLDNQSEAKGHLLNIVSNGSNDLLQHLDRALPSNAEILKTFNHKLQMLTEIPLGFRLTPSNVSKVLMATSTLYLMNNSLGDSLSADFFLMKTVRINQSLHQHEEHELLFEYLSNVMLSN